MSHVSRKIHTRQCYRAVFITFRCHCHSAQTFMTVSWWHLEFDVFIGAHQSEPVDEAELDDGRDEEAGGDDAEQAAEEDEHAELEAPERHQFLEAEQHSSDRRSERHGETGRRASRHEVSPATVRCQNLIT